MFSNAKTLVRVFGLDIRVDPSWLLIAALITWSLSQHVFPAVLPDHSKATYFSMAVTATLLFFASLLLHELAHAFTGRRYGVETRTITLFLFGGVAELAEEPKRATDELWIALAGPLMSFALFCVFWVLASASALATMPVSLIEIFRYLALINLVLAVFNLIPAFPLDGGRVLRAWLWQRSGDVLSATESAAHAGTFFAYGLMGLGAISLFQGSMVGGIWQILLGMFILAAAKSSVEAQRAKSLLGDKTVADLLTPSPVVTAPNTTLAELVNQIMLRNRVSFIPVVEDQVLLGHIDSAVLAGMDRENWANTRVSDVFVGLADNVVVTPNTPITDLFTRIAETGQRKFMVVENRQLVGVITLADLSRYLALVKDIGRIAGSAPLLAAQ